MPVIKRLEIKESISQLKALCKGKSFSIQKRIQMLISIKKATKNNVSKRKLSALIGVNHNSITCWKKVYLSSGIEGILVDGRIGFKPSIIAAEHYEKISTKLHNATNNINGYKELQEWVKEALLPDIKYITILKYAQRHFKTKIKVCRKSHIKKDDAAIETFKKTLVKSAKK